MNEKKKKAGEISQQLGLHNLFLEKSLTRAIFFLAPAANMFGIGRFPFGCMIWQQFVILESICETNPIMILIPA